MFKPLPSSFLIACAACASAQGGFDDGGGRQRPSPFAPPNAQIRYAPDRTCDLLNIDVDIDVDYANRLFKGTSVNTLSPLRNGITEVMLNAGPDLKINSVKVDGQEAKYRRSDYQIFIATPPLTKGKAIKIAISYEQQNSRGRSFGGEGGWHWIEPRDGGDPNRVGFWTQGESHYNCKWAPTWDYPNDLATSEVRCTVQADWDVIGNGVLVSTKTSADKKRKTYDWKMTQPHATYLLSLVGGPFDIKKDKWEGVDLWYVVPRGKGNLIDSSFGHTKDMLTYYSSILGVKYAWPKYAQNAMYDFGGGMENVSATTMQADGALTEAKDGYFNMDSLNSHELGHQWFGDLVTCMSWGDAWLNESFATYMQIMYFDHSRGKHAYDWEIENAMRSYFSEARRYKRPISTRMYPNDDAMFDSHTYPKGGVVLHTLRRQLGDEAFFAGLNYYLKTWRHTPVESAQLRRAMTEATGINVEGFWAQWIEKPGHPVIDYSWRYEDGKVKLTVKQTQDTSDGTPIYDVPAKVDFISAGGQHTVLPIHLTKADETFEFTAAKPGAVVFDPRHEFLRQIPTLHWEASELPLIFQYGQNAPDRAMAMSLLLNNEPSDATIKMVADVLAKDTAESPAFPSVANLSVLAKPELRSFWLKQVDHADVTRAQQAVVALGRLPADAATTAKLRSLINDKEFTVVVVEAINVLAKFDKAGNADVFKAALNIKDMRNRIKTAAERALAP